LRQISNGRSARFGLEDFKRRFAEVATFPIVPPDVPGDPADYLTSSGLACIGTPDDCIRHFERQWKGSPTAGAQMRSVLQAAIDRHQARTA
jgi:hypothetical protein